MKKLISLICVVLVASAMIFAQGGKEKTSEEVQGSIAALAKEAESFTHEQLVSKAAEEKGVFKVYGNTSRIATAVEAFGKLYNIETESSDLKDSEIYEKLEIEIEGKINGADMVMIQDGAQLKSQMLSTGNLVNFIPSSVKEYIDESDRNPLVQQYLNKLFIWNKLGPNVKNFTNVWQLTEPQMKGNVIFKSPEQEQVNMNFLVMCTSDKWADALAKAYKDLYGKDIELGSYKNAGYKWVAEFLGNCTFIKSDTTIATEISQETAEGKVGLFVLSKLRSSSVKSENLTVGQYLASQTGVPIEPFSGFMYPMYAMITKNATRPYTAMLFIEYLMTKEGFEPWGKSIGAYSGNKNIPAKEEDLPLAVWKGCLVTEDADYILENYEAVTSFIIKEL